MQFWKSLLMFPSAVLKKLLYKNSLTASSCHDIVSSTTQYIWRLYNQKKRLYLYINLNMLSKKIFVWNYCWKLSAIHCKCFLKFLWFGQITGFWLHSEWNKLNWTKTIFIQTIILTSTNCNEMCWKSFSYNQLLFVFS